MAAGDKADKADDLAFQTIFALQYQDGLSIEEGGGVRLDYFAMDALGVVQLAVCPTDGQGRAQEQGSEAVYIDALTMDEIAKAWLQWRINATDETRNRIEQLTPTTVEQDVETARQSFADLLVVEGSMTAAAARMRDQLRWFEAISTLGIARGLLQRFIGERLTSDIAQAHPGNASSDSAL